MAHENFHGDRLRLSAFLRIVDGVPQRPSRCRRRCVPSAENNDKHDFDRRLTQIQSTTIGTNDPCSHLKTVPSHDDEVLPRVDDGFDSAHGSPVQKPQSQRNGTYSKENNTSIRKSKAGMTRSKIKRHLPINELALVRTSTADGLPDRGEEGTRASIAETDPNEDSQSIVSRSDLKLSFDPGSSQLHPERYSKHVFITPVWKTDIRGRRHIAPSSALDAIALSDGFNSTERFLPLRVKQRRAATKKKKLVLTVPVRCQLDLVTGELPSPTLEDFGSLRSLDNVSGHSEIPHNGVTRSDDMLQHGERRVLSTHSSQPVTEAVVYSQLASISAPTRINDSSDSSSEQAEDDSDDSSRYDGHICENLQYDSMDDSEHDHIDYPETFEQSPNPARMLFDAGRLQLNDVSAIEEDFWTQYGDLEG